MKPRFLFTPSMLTAHSLLCPAHRSPSKARDRSPDSNLAVPPIAFTPVRHPSPPPLSPMHGVSLPPEFLLPLPVVRSSALVVMRTWFCFLQTTAFYLPAISS